MAGAEAETRDILGPGAKNKYRVLSAPQQWFYLALSVQAEAGRLQSRAGGRWNGPRPGALRQRLPLQASGIGTGTNYERSSLSGSALRVRIQIQEAKIGKICQISAENLSWKKKKLLFYFNLRLYLKNTLKVSKSKHKVSYFSIQLSKNFFLSFFRPLRPIFTSRIRM